MPASTATNTTTLIVISIPASSRGWCLNGKVKVRGSSRFTIGSSIVNLAIWASGPSRGARGARGTRGGGRH